MRRSLFLPHTCRLRNPFIRNVASSSTCHDQELYAAFNRHQNQEQKHKAIKDVLRTKAPPHDMLKEHMQILISANNVTREEELERVALLDKVRRALQNTFGKNEVDVIDISMPQYGIDVYQAPFELAMVDLKNPNGLPRKINPTGKSIYAPKQVLKCIKSIAEQARWDAPPSASIPRSRHQPVQHRPPIEVKPWQLPSLAIRTPSFNLSFPSPLHVYRVKLLRSYMEDYPILQQLLSIVYLFHYTAGFTKFGTMGLAFHVLTFFLNCTGVPAYWDPNNRYGTAPKPTLKSTNKEERVEQYEDVVSMIYQQGGYSRKVERDLIKVATTSSPKMIVSVKHDLVPIGHKEYRLLCAYLQWTLDTDMRMWSITPGRGLLSRFMKPNGMTKTPQSEAKLLRLGKLAREEVPVESQTWDWETALMVVQDPFWPRENHTPYITPGDLRRVRHFCEGYLALMAEGIKLSTTLEANMHPNIEPPKFPGHQLVAAYSQAELVHTRQPGRILSIMVNEAGMAGQKRILEGEGRDRRLTAAEILRVSRAVEQEGVVEHKEKKRKEPSNSVRTPEDLEGDLFR